MSAAFTPGPVELRIIRPECRITVDGWSDGTFGIDRRIFEDDNWNDRVAHTITHLRTGGVVCNVKGRVSNAKKIASILHKASWDFDDPAVCKEGGRQEVANEAKATGLLVSSVSVRQLESTIELIAKARGEQ